MNPANGVILQLMDSDQPDIMMMADKYLPPIGEVDVAVPGRDLTVANTKEDVFMTISNMEVTGDFYNSTTNLKANCREKDLVDPNKKHVMPDIEAMDDPFKGVKPDFAAGQGAKNLDLKFVNAKVKGIITSATAAHKGGVTEIDVLNNREIGAVTQTAHEPVNNGVIVSFDKDCVWTIAGNSYLTSLTITRGSVIKAPEGKKLTMTVDGVKKTIAPGKYTGKIVITVV